MKANRKVLFIDTVHPLIKETFEQKGFRCDFFPDYAYEDFLKIIPDYEGVIIRSKIPLDRNILNKAGNLRFIGRVGAGMENIDLAFAKSKGIACFNSPEGSRDAVGEHTVGLLLSLFRNIHKADREVRKGEWIREANRGLELKDKTFGIIGYGNMGSAFAEKLSGFGARVISYDKYKKAYADKHTREVDMDTIYAETDILSLHVPLTRETTYLFNSAYLQKFKKNIFLINTARGLCVDTLQLVEGLKTGKVRGAAIDVLEYEDKSFEMLDKQGLPEAYRYLAGSDNVVLTSHIAGWTHESKYKLAKVLVDKIMNYLKQ